MPERSYNNRINLAIARYVPSLAEAAARVFSLGDELKLRSLFEAAAALYTFARKRGCRVLCLAQVTNIMGLAGQDFEKGKAQGADEALRVLEALAQNLK